jgi:hypothetical protein
MYKNNIVYVLCGLALLVLLLYGQKPVQWVATYDLNDTQPFGSHALSKLLPDYVGNNETLSVVYHNFSELNAGSVDKNILMISTSLSIDDKELEELEYYIAKGNTVVIAAENFSEDFAHFYELNFNESFLNFDRKKASVQFFAGDTEEICFLPLKNYPQATFSFATEAALTTFSQSGNSFEELAQTASGELVLAKKTIGEGALYLSTTPKLFTNYYLLRNNASHYVAGILSPLVGKPLAYARFYQAGRNEAQTPLRYILSQPALRYSYWLVVLGVLLFIFFYGKRRQRVIPVIEPPKNSSLTFAHTLGQLYYQQKDHRNLAQKRLRYWQNFVQKNYLINRQLSSSYFISELTAKSGAPAKTVAYLAKMHQRAETANTITEADLPWIEKHLQLFYTHHSTNGKQPVRV